MSQNSNNSSNFDFLMFHLLPGLPSPRGVFFCVYFAIFNSVEKNETPCFFFKSATRKALTPKHRHQLFNDFNSLPVPLRALSLTKISVVPIADKSSTHPVTHDIQHHYKPRSLAVRKMPVIGEWFFFSFCIFFPSADGRGQQ